MHIFTPGSTVDGEPFCHNSRISIKIIQYIIYKELFAINDLFNALLPSNRELQGGKDCNHLFTLHFPEPCPVSGRELVFNRNFRMEWDDGFHRAAIRSVQGC